jgi:hypothetical protein
MIAYLVDEKGLIRTRNKEIKIRPLDREQASSEKLTWQIINLILPVTLLVIYGVARYYWRRKKFAGF